MGWLQYSCPLWLSRGNPYILYIKAINRADVHNSDQDFHILLFRHLPNLAASPGRFWRGASGRPTRDPSLRLKGGFPQDDPT
jgi:hypothetical protein